MSVITVAAVQAAPLSVTGLPVFGRDDTLAAFAADVRSVRSQISGPALLVYPEFHLFGIEDSPAEECDRLLRAAGRALGQPSDRWARRDRVRRPGVADSRVGL